MLRVRIDGKLAIVETKGPAVKTVGADGQVDGLVLASAGSSSPKALLPVADPLEVGPVFVELLLDESQVAGPREHEQRHPGRSTEQAEVVGVMTGALATVLASSGGGHHRHIAGAVSLLPTQFRGGTSRWWPS